MGSFKFRSNHQDFWAGVMFLGLGILAVYLSKDYPLGRAMRMGPGYFPTYLGWAMIIIGAIVGGRSFFKDPGPDDVTTKWAVVPLALMPASVAVFAVPEPGFVSIWDVFGLFLVFGRVGMEIASFKL
jgi:putative tricarboxylic transport membrane protein